jgi:glycosyltransferase involved in cell wall biosynthesis
VKILHLIHSGAVGGGPKVVLELASRLPGSHTILTADDGPLLADAARKGIATELLRFSGEYSFALSVPLLVRFFRAFDLIHLHGQFAAFYGAIAAGIARSPAVVYTAHFPSFVTDSSWGNAKRNHIAESVPGRICTAVVACSETSRREYLARKLVPQDSIRTIYNGVAIQKPMQAAARTRLDLDIAQSDPIVLGMGRFTDQKGFDILLDAMPLILKRATTTRLVLVGDGEKRSELEQQSRRLGIEQAVRFTGFRQDTAELLDASTVVAVPSRYDVFPLVPLEAMMAERAVVVSDLPALRETIEDGVTGVVAPLRPESFAASVGDLIEDDARRDAISSRAGMRARERFSVERMVEEYEQLYRDLGEHSK